MDRGFGADEPVECVERGRCDPRRKVRPGDGFDQRAGSTFGNSGVVDDLDVGRGDPVALGARDLDLHVAEPEGADGVMQHLVRRARIEERGEQHVTGEPADAVQVRDRRHRAARRAIRAATVPAPSPSSIPTTARPSAHEESIACSAVSP